MGRRHLKRWLEETVEIVHLICASQLASVSCDALDRRLPGELRRRTKLFEKFFRSRVDNGGLNFTLDTPTLQFEKF